MSSSDSTKGVGKTIRNALTLDGNFYENARNTSKNRQIARNIVFLAALSHAIGSAVILLVSMVRLPMLLLAVLINGISVAAGYYFWTFTILKIGHWLRPNSPSYRELLIPIGFAYAPQVLNFLTLIPLLGIVLARVLAIWSLLAVIVAVRQGLDINTWQAALICLVGWPLILLAINSVQVFQQELLGRI